MTFQAPFQPVPTNPAVSATTAQPSTFMSEGPTERFRVLENNQRVRQQQNAEYRKHFMVVNRVAAKHGMKAVS